MEFTSSTLTLLSNCYKTHLTQFDLQKTICLITYLIPFIFQHYFTLTFKLGYEYCLISYICALRKVYLHYNEILFQNYQKLYSFNQRENEFHFRIKQKLRSLLNILVVDNFWWKISRVGWFGTNKNFKKTTDFFWMLWRQILYWIRENTWFFTFWTKLFFRRLHLCAPKMSNSYVHRINMF